MNKAFKDLHKAFENRVRLQIMAVLCANEQYDFNAMKDNLQLTDGNLSSHIKVLEGEGFVNVEKTYAGRKPLTIYTATESGKEAFRKHIAAIESIIKSSA
jgi:DNA-binding MarR family transcriptional regulator